MNREEKSAFDRCKHCNEAIIGGIIEGNIRRALASHPTQLTSGESLTTALSDALRRQFHAKAVPFANIS